MRFLYLWLLPAIWLAWAAYWVLGQRDFKKTLREEDVGSRLLHVIPMAMAALLLWTNRLPFAFLHYRLYPATFWGFVLGASVTVGGLLFTVWARVHLGRNWSGMVTIKENHELITSGPYAIVRHPIYTGLLIAFFGSALARGEVRGVLAVILVFAALWRKLRHEERWMEERFGDQYRTYSQRVPPLLPFLKM